MRKKRILYADDDLDDRTWVNEACKSLNNQLAIDFVENGRQVLDRLSLLSDDALPALIVLDLNMPQLDGRQTLSKLKTNERFKSIPVVIVTTSSNKVDIEICNRLGAALYLTKPDKHAEWQLIVTQFVPFVS